MLPSSHLAPIHLPAEDGPARAAALADAFTEFTAAANRLEQSYQELQTEVTQLRAILTERTLALRSSREENQQMKLALRQILDSLPCGVLVVDGKRRITLSNPEARRLLGVTDERIESLEDIPSPSRRALADTLQSSEYQSSEEEFCFSGAAAKRWIAVRSRKLSGAATIEKGDSGKLQQDVLILRDSSSQKKLEEEREAARNAVALAEVSAVLAHEIRNPLGSLELFAGLIAENSAGAEGYVAHLHAGIRRLSATVNNVLRFHGGGTPQQSRVTLGEALRQAVDFARPLATQGQIALLLADQLAGACIAGDANALQQLFLNLALNAFRHTPAGGRLHITARRTSGDHSARAQVEFCDSGCGIAPELASRIFEPGFSGNGQTPGLGLAVCRKIVEQHGGSIRVSSRVGEGATFSMEFPIEP